MSWRTLAVAASVVVIIAGSLAYAFYVNPGIMNPSRTYRADAVVSIPPGVSTPPPQFDVTKLLNGQYRYPFNFTVVVGVNNTVTFENNDTLSHTVSSFQVPKGASAFNSDLIPPGGIFKVTLSVPGTYRYTCMWHPWLAGEISVRAG